MKTIARSIALESFSLYLLSQLFPGVIIVGGLQTLLFGGFVLSLLSLILRPVLQVLSVPFALITFGLVHIITNAIILFVLTRIISKIHIYAFTWSGISLFGVIVPKIHFGPLVAFLVVAAGQWMIKWFLTWLTEN